MRFCLLFLSTLVVATINITAQVIDRYTSPLPPQFIENQGQWNSSQLFGIFSGAHSGAFFRDGFSFSRFRKLRTQQGVRLSEVETNLEPPPSELESLHIRFVNPSAMLCIAASDKRKTVSHFYNGESSDYWYENVSNYGKLIYNNVWNGIDIEYFFKADKLIQRFIVHENGDIRNIKIKATSNGLDTSDYQLQLTGALSGGDHTSSVYIQWENDTWSFDTCCDTYGPFIFDTEFSTYFGGNSINKLSKIATDRSGCCYVAGSTTSTDFPTKNAICDGAKSFWVGFHAGFAQNGCLLYSTFICNSISIESLDIGADNSVWVYGFCTEYYDRSYHNGFLAGMSIPLTPNAFDSHLEATDVFLMQFNSNGTLRYSTYLGGPGYDYPYDMATDKDGNIYCAMSCMEAPVPFITPNAMKIAFNVDCENHCLVKLSPDGKSIVFATYFLDDFSTFFIYDMEIDSQGNTVLVGHTGTYFTPHNGLPYNKQLSPLIGPLSRSQSGMVDAAIVKINNTGTNIIFSTCFGGNDADFFRNVAIDRSDNIYVAGTTRDSLFPVFDPIPPSKVPLTFYDPPTFTKFSSDGHILSSSYLSGAYIFDIAADDCNNVFIYGAGLYLPRHLPLVIPTRRMTKEIGGLSSLFLLALDSSLSQCLFFTEWVESSSYRQQSSNNSVSYPSFNLLSLQNGDCYFSFPYSPYSDLPQQHPCQIMDDSVTSFLSKIHVPLCDLDQYCEVIAPDTLRIYRNGSIISPVDISIPIRLVNSGSKPLNSINMEIDVDARLKLPQISDSTSVIPGIIFPGDSVTHIWKVHINESTLGDGKTCIRSLSTYLIDNAIPFYSVCNHVMYIQVVDVEMKCTVTSPDTLYADETDSTLIQNPFTISCNIKNTSHAAVDSCFAILRHEFDLPISSIPIGDSTQYLGRLEPNETRNISWNLVVSPRSKPRMAHFVVESGCKYGKQLSECFDSTFIEPVRGLYCSTRCLDTLHIGKTGGDTHPKPIIAGIEISNNLDTSQRSTVVEIDLTNAPHLMLSAGSPQKQSIYSIEQHSSDEFVWLLDAATPLDTYADETVTFTYSSLTDTTKRSCSCIIHLIPLTAGSTCTIEAPSQLTTAQNSYLGNPFDLSYTLVNTGSAQQDVRFVEIQLPSFLSTAQQTTVPVTPLPPNDNHILKWSISAQTSAFERDATIVVTAYDANHVPIIDCSHHLYLPSVQDLSCSSQSVEHILFNDTTKKYDPDPFIASLTVYNNLDTVQQLIDAEIDFSSSPHVSQAAGVQKRQSIDSLAADSSHTFEWLLNVLPSSSQVHETIRFKYRSANHNEWRECSWDVAVDEEGKTYSAGCEAEGIDSLWLTNTRELLIPNPFQVSCRILNNGTGVLQDCYGTVSLPQNFEFPPGESPTKYFGTIEPGVSEIQSWMIAANPSTVQVGQHTISFSYTSPSLTPGMPCTHSVYVQQQNEINLELSHRALFFVANQDGPLPPAQQVAVFAGSPAVMPWTIAGSPVWLDVQPSTGGTTAVAVQPNTTSMQAGIYTGNIAFQSSAPNSPKSVAAIYKILRLVDVERTPEAAVPTLLQNYPNPFTESTTISFTVRTSMRVRISIYNTLGNLVCEYNIDAQPGVNAVPVSQLLSGLYMYALSSSEGTVCRRMVRK